MAALLAASLAWGTVARAGATTPTKVSVTPPIVGKADPTFTITWIDDTAVTAETRGYSLERRTQGEVDWTLVADAIGSVQYSDRVQTSGVFQYRLVRHDIPTNTDDPGVESDPVTADLIPPTSPGDFSVKRSLVDGALELRWSQSTDSGGMGLAGYRAFTNSPLGTRVLTVDRTLTQTVFPETSVAPSGSYQFDLRAVDGAENLSAAAPPVQFQIPTYLYGYVPPMEVVRGQPFAFEVKAKDHENLAIPFDATIELLLFEGGVLAPAGTVVDDDTGLDRFVMTTGDSGRRVVMVRIDQAGAFELGVADAHLPNLFSKVPLTVVEPEAPKLLNSPNTLAAVGRPYLYDLGGSIIASGPGPITFGQCGGPDSFRVDATSGAVRWIPAAPGQVDLCIYAQNQIGTAVLTTSQSFTVDVLELPPSLLVADFSTSVQGGRAPLLVTFTGSDSQQTEPVIFQWDFGDGSPPQATLEPSVSHSYTRPGSYWATLTVRDHYGNQSVERRPVSVTDSLDRRPPVALIKASATRGDGQLRVDFACDCQDGDAEIVAYRWDLDERTQSWSPRTEKIYGPGRYRVRLTVVDANGLAAWDEQEIVVTAQGKEPPECSVSATPSSGPAPLDVAWVGLSAPGSATVVGREWKFSDGTTSPRFRVPVRYEQPGWVDGTLLVTDQYGLRCFARGSIAVLGATGLVPPELMVSLPREQATCGRAYEGAAAESLVAMGSGPFHWSVQSAPAGVEIDEASGAIRWKPLLSQRGEQTLLLRAENDAGKAEHAFTVEVTCADSVDLETPFGCSTSSGAPLVWLLAALGSLLALRRSGGVRRRQ